MRRAEVGDKIPVGSPASKEAKKQEAKKAEREAARLAVLERDAAELKRRKDEAEAAANARSEASNDASPPPPPPPALASAPPPPIASAAPASSLAGLTAACVRLSSAVPVSTAHCETQTGLISVVNGETQTEPVQVATCETQTELIQGVTCETQTEPIRVATCETQTEPVQAATCETQTEPIQVATRQTQTEETVVTSRGVQTVKEPLHDLLFRVRDYNVCSKSPAPMRPNRIAPPLREKAALVMSVAASVAAIALPGLAMAEVLILPPGVILLLAMTAVLLAAKLISFVSASARARAVALSEQRQTWASEVQAFASDASDTRLWAWMTQAGASADSDAASADFAAFERDLKQRCPEFMAFARLGLVHADTFEHAGQDVRAVLAQLLVHMKS